MDNVECSKYQVGIIGAGPAGLTAAYQLSKQGVSVQVFEAGPSVGGMAQTISLWNQRVDIGPHRFFSSDARVNSLWLEVVGDDFEMVDRLTRIYYKNRFFFYPLKPVDALVKLGTWEATRCLASYAAQQFKKTLPKAGFEAWVTGRFGRRLFEIFFKTYSEKLWGIPCHELDSDFAAQRIKQLSLFGAVVNALRGGRGNTQKTLVEQFAYPHGGTGIVYERMAEDVRTHGGQIFCHRPVQRVLNEGGTVTGLETVDGERHRFDHVISTMPLSLLVTRLPEVPSSVKQAAESLQFRNTVIVYLKVESSDLFQDQWLYIHSDDLQMGRVTNFRNWVPQLYGEEPSSILALEYWCNSDEPTWTATDETLIDLGKKELRRTGLIGDAAISDGHIHRIPRCYPVYRCGYKDPLETIQQYLSSLQGLSVIGRYGAFKYNNQDHSLLMGLLAAENISEGTSHNLWDINTDYENYQEQSVITKTGLLRKPFNPPPLRLKHAG